MESFACLIQTHTRQDEEGTRERKRERWKERGRLAEKDRKDRGRKTQSTRKRLLRQVDGEGERGKVALRLPPPTTQCLYLSKESSVLAQELKPLSPCAGALCPGAPASFGARGCRAQLASAKLGISERDNWQITVQQDVCCYRWKDLSSIPYSIPFSSMTPPAVSWQGSLYFITLKQSYRLQICCWIN